MTSKKEQNMWKKGIWQYMLDHATPEYGAHRITFRVESEADFWNRVRARKTGEYKRTDAQKYEERAEAQRRRMERLIQGKKMRHEAAVKKYQRIEYLKHHGTVMEKLRMTLFRILRVLLNRINPV